VRLARAWFAAALLLGGCTGDDVSAADTTTSVPATSAEAVERFSAAWRRHLMGTWTIEGTLSRSRIGGDGSLSDRLREVQRPPDRLRLELGVLGGQLDGRIVTCAGSPIRCRDGGTAPPYDAAVDAVVQRLTNLVDGPSATYSLSEPAGPAGASFGASCFRIDVVDGVLNPAEGEEATWCFDDATGALVESTVVRGDVRIEQRVTEVSGEADPAELVLPAPLEAG
jgi:hypothetical protein